MKAVNLAVEPFSYITYTELECVRELNCHGSLRVRGLISQEKEAQYTELACGETWVNVKAISGEGEETVFFTGILTGFYLKKENQVTELTIEVKTGSFLLDIQPHIRSFQNPRMEYREVIRACTGPAGGAVIMLEKKHEVTGRILMQYEETDWAFFRRLASYANTVLIAEDVTPGRRFYFGYRVREALDEPKWESHRLIRDWEGFRRSASLGIQGLRQEDAISHTIRTREMIRLGESVWFDGQLFVVGRADSRLEGQELWHTYSLITKRAGLLPELRNQALTGVSLKGNVLAVEQTQVQVRIQADENRENSQSCWMDYATIYSTPDGMGWYCMPEIGDEVRLVFPDGDERHVYAAGSVHLGAAAERTDPNRKSWKNRQGKEILFTPDSILLRNNKGLSLELSDVDGIRLCSDTDIVMQSAGDIRIGSQGGVHLSAKNNISMQQGAASIRLDHEIRVAGGKIYMN